MRRAKIAAMMLLLCVGGTQNLVRGEDRLWLQELKNQAAQGDLTAQYSLGVRYAQGQGVPRDSTKAVKWLRLAAAQGDSAAQFLLGGMYYRGEGTPSNYVQAYKWADLAASALTGPVHNEAIKLRELAATHMTPAQIAEVQRLAGEEQATDRGK